MKVKKQNTLMKLLWDIAVAPAAGSAVDASGAAAASQHIACNVLLTVSA